MLGEVCGVHWTKEMKKSEVYEQSESCVGCFVDFQYSFY